MDIEVQSIKRGHYERIKRGSMIAIEMTPDGYCVHQWTPDGVAPQSSYGTAAEAVARVAQLLRLSNPVPPQDWPEAVQVGNIVSE
jgi:hypothetical protein